MKKSVIIIDLPQLSDEHAVLLHSFLEELLKDVESHYFPQLRRCNNIKRVSFEDDEDPF